MARLNNKKRSGGSTFSVLLQTRIDLWMQRNSLLSTIDQVLEGDIVEEAKYLITQLIPEMMRQTALPITTILTTTTPRELNPLVHGADNIGDRDFTRRLTKIISSSRTAHASHKLFCSQRRKQLLEVGERNPLTNRNIRQCDGAFT